MKNIFHIALLLILTGCQTGTGQIGDNYVSLAPAGQEPTITKLKKWQAPSYYHSSSLEDDVSNLENRGYVILGSSIFSDTGFPFGHAANQAVKIGATHVIFSEVSMHPAISGTLKNLNGFPAFTLMGFSAAPPLSGVNVDNIMTGGGNNNNTTTYQNYYYDSTSYPGVAVNYQCYFFAKPTDHHVNFGLSFADNVSQGIIIEQVETGTVAQLLGLQTADIITAINDQDVVNTEQAEEILNNVDELSDQTTFFVQRDGEDFIALTPPILTQ